MLIMNEAAVSWNGRQSNDLEPRLALVFFVVATLFLKFLVFTIRWRMQVTILNPFSRNYCVGPAQTMLLQREKICSK